jgi:mRNA interferase MazF
VKIRPALIVQSDDIDSDLSQVVLVMISSNLRRIGLKTRYLIEIETESDGSSGLLVDSVVMTDNIATVLRSRIIRILGRLDSMTEVDNALRHSLNL